MPPKSEASLEKYWEPTYRALFEACYQELLADALIGRWQLVDICATYLVAVTVSGSAVAGWALWSKSVFKDAWSMLAGFAALTSIAQGTLAIPRRVKELEDLRRHFSQLRVEIDSFLQRLKVGLNVNKAEAQLRQLQVRLAENVGRVGHDLALTEGLKNRTQDNVDERLRLKGES